MVTESRTHNALDTRLVGRSVELTSLASAIEDVRGHGVHLVLLSGAAGVGKTSLLKMAQTALAAEGVIVRYAQSSANSDNLHTISELMGIVVSGASQLSDGEQYATFDVFDRVVAFVERATSRGTLVLLVDDADQCDKLSLRCLDFVLRRASELPLLLVLSHRTVESGVPWQLASGTRTSTSIELGSFSRAELALLVRAGLGHEPSERFLDVCAKLTGGVPGLAKQLLAELDALGVQPHSDSAAVVAGRVGPEVVARPAFTFLCAHPGHVWRIACGVAVLGPVSGRLLATLLGTSEVSVDRTAELLREHRVLMADRLDFEHKVLREWLLARMPLGEVEALRLRGARLLHDEGRPASEVARLLVNLTDVREPWMSAVLWDAASEARRTGDNSQASRLAENLLEAAPDDAASAAELSTTLCAFAPETAIAYFVQAMDLADDRSRNVLVQRLGDLALSSPPRSSLFHALVDALNTGVDRVGDARGQLGEDLRARVESATLSTGLGDMDTLLNALERTREIQVPDASTPAKRALLGQLARAAAIDGKCASEVLRLARAAVSGPKTALDLKHGVLYPSVSLYLAGAPLESLAVLSAAVDNHDNEARADGAPWLCSEAEAVETVILLDTGNLAGAAEVAKAARDRAGATAGVPVRLAATSVLLERGQFRQVERLLTTLKDIRLTGRDRQLVRLHLARARYELGDVETAVALTERTLTDFKTSHPMLIRFFLPVADLLDWLGGSRKLAAVLLEPWLLSAEHWGSRESVALALAVRGHLARGDDGLAFLREANEMLVDSPYALYRMRTEYLYSRALLGCGDAAGAREHSRLATMCAVQRGFSALAARSRDVLIAAGGRMKELTGSVVDLLTESEQRVAVLAAAGIANREIAKELFVSLRTVEIHLSSTYRKLGVKSRRQLSTLLSERTSPEFVLAEDFA
ncbi:helix-turn-helix transcriptional regulator [Amycolatopsis sp. H20-H5]|uniref:helix-turn-helix transcriptional regulator n=1 Tax=Amycolatopsis sp. H20-H5 TaxID=3046309 RepID=UPI002DB8B3C3|nr:AAA family ATPase [Amycolatopsis sp. H20-H5]MEC3975559.1 AAA family ATPase [Amycolatopsis sp. H20-H5]